MSKRRGPRINGQIKGHKTVRVISPEGEQLGIMLLSQAMEKSEELRLDLVEVSPDATPAVCKIMDYGKQDYKRKKQSQKAKAKSSGSQKELRLKPRIGNHDLKTKLRNAKKFLGDGLRVQFTMIYKGRELAHRELGEEVLERVAEELVDVAKVETPAHREGRSVKMVVCPK